MDATSPRPPSRLVDAHAREARGGVGCRRGSPHLPPLAQCHVAGLKWHDEDVSSKALTTFPRERAAERHEDDGGAAQRL